MNTGIYNSRIHYDHCPACGSTSIRHVLTAKDHTVTDEQFQIWHCDTCTLRFTQDVPDEMSIGPYYKSQDYISHSDDAKGIINSLYKKVRVFTLGQKRKLIQKFSNNKTGDILDVGSGTGAFVNEMKRHGWVVSGLEPDPDARKVAKEKYGINLGNIEQLYTLPPATFDVITMWHVLEHVHRLQDCVAQLKKLLKPGGTIFIAVPNYTSKDAVMYREYWAAYDVPRHLYHFSPYAMEKLMNRHGLKIQKFLPMWFDSYYVSMLSNKYRSGNPGLVSAVLKGSLSNMKALGNARKCSSVIYVIR